ncbi:response regulator transcription factor [Pseudoalteromonas sp. MMG012]|uniref:response regulator transcription factor n=1 Tax=Pseudoalteromonas sp. MMG012 TaxID=2822686 RepID=UPI001B3A68FE|nr:response regulator transcription factor [Pseudoalteromonas sp. MMG012]MBQ4850895.1 response regulator transcription factor [Pseudoalteromonas sp. MMG012]
MSAPILVIEDDPLLNQQVCALLEKRGFNVTCVHDGEQGLTHALAHDYELIILDIRLPLIEGYEVLSQLRKCKQTPVLILSACGAEQDRIKGLSMGADDYLPKPFNIEELILRVEAILRRSQHTTQLTNSYVFEANGLLLNKRQLQAKFNDVQIEMTAIQFKLLWHLAENAGEALSKPYLYQQVLERQFSRYDRSLDMHLSRLRKKLIAVGMSAESITTLHGRGYSFNA